MIADGETIFSKRREGRFPEQFSATIRPHRAQKLYYVTASFTLEDRPPVSLPPATAVVDIGPYVETKIAAFKAHSSQTPLFSMFQEHVRRRGSVELFHLAANVHPGPVVQENDLFAGVVDAE